jgi:hypothetical protein
MGPASPLSRAASSAKKRLSQSFDFISLTSALEANEKQDEESFDRDSELAEFGDFLGAGASNINHEDSNFDQKSISEVPLLKREKSPTGKGRLIPVVGNTTTITSGKMSNRANSEQSFSQTEFSWGDITVTTETTVVSELRQLPSTVKSTDSDVDEALCNHKTSRPNAEGNFRCKCGAIEGTTTVITGPMRTVDKPNPSRTRVYPYVFTSIILVSRLVKSLALMLKMQHSSNTLSTR